ncbi:MAG: hypothetical protein RL248_2100 [Pseudomonadota bacterium]
MAESEIRLLRQNQGCIQAVRCYEDILSNSDFSAVQLLSCHSISRLFPTLLFSVLISPNNPPCDIVFTQVLSLSKSFEGLRVHVIRIFIGIIGCKGNQNLIRM